MKQNTAGYEGPKAVKTKTRAHGLDVMYFSPEPEITGTSVYLKQYFRKSAVD